MSDEEKIDFDDEAYDLGLKGEGVREWGRSIARRVEEAALARGFRLFNDGWKLSGIERLYAEDKKEGGGR